MTDNITLDHSAYMGLTRRAACHSSNSHEIAATPDANFGIEEALVTY